MSDNGEVEVDTPAFRVLPKEVEAEIGSVKLFNKWTYEDVEIRDISLTFVLSLNLLWLSILLTRISYHQRLHPNPLPRIHFSFRRPIRRQALPQIAVPHCRETDQLAHDEGPQQWQKDHGSAHSFPCV